MKNKDCIGVSWKIPRRACRRSVRQCTILTFLGVFGACAAPQFVPLGIDYSPDMNGQNPNAGIVIRLRGWMMKMLALMNFAVTFLCRGGFSPKPQPVAALAFALTVTLWQQALAGPSTSVPTSPSISFARPNDYRLLVQDRHSDGTLGKPLAYTAQGVAWEPTSIGTDPTANPLVFQSEFTNWYATDLPLIASMGCNTVRMYYDFGNVTNGLQILDRMYQLGLKAIIPTDWAQYGSVASLRNVTNVVTAYKNHPAVLSFSVGNEWDLPNGPNATYYYGAFTNLYASANFIQQAATVIKLLDTNHVVTTFMADPHIWNVHPLSPTQFPFELARPYTSDMVNSICTNIDVWCFNVYRGNSFQDLFIQWRSISTKPMIIGEFGADAYNHAISNEDQGMQSHFDTRLFDEGFYNFSASRSNGCCAGVIKFEFQDEWYKNGSPSVQNWSNESNSGQPDGFNDEEYFGFTDINRAPRQEYYDLGTRFRGGSAATLLVTNPVLTAVSAGAGSGAFAQFGIDEKTLFYRQGGQFGGRGINVAVIDGNTGIRLSDMKSFDTWYDFNNFNALVSYLQGLPNGTLFMLAVCDSALLNDYSYDSRIGNALTYLQSLGSTMVQNAAYYYSSWAMIGVIGQGKLAEGLDNTTTGYVTITAKPTLIINPNIGLYPVPQISGAPSPRNGWTLSISEPGASGIYQIEMSSDLQNWSTVATIQVDPSGITTWTDPAPSSTRRFYRVYQGM
jgi:hypothetical protein